METKLPQLGEPGRLTPEPSVGIVLPGGGARGAFQAGSALYLAEHFVQSGFPVRAIAGAGVGALHGAILASAPTFLQGAQNLVELWRTVGRLPPARLKVFRGLPTIELGVLVSLLLSAGVSTSLPKLIEDVGKTAARAVASEHHISPVLEALMEILHFQPEVKLGTELSERIRGLLDGEASSGIALYVSVYPGRGALLDSLRLILQNIGSFDTTFASQLVHIQSLAVPSRWEMVLASAGMPILFDAQEISGKDWSGGPIGDWRADPGQIPAHELCQKEAISRLYILHASDGSLWDRRGAGLPLTIELRPSRTLQPGGSGLDSLRADAVTIESRLDQGYEDARRTIQGIQPILDAAHDGADARELLRNEMRGIGQDE